jgi:hypothetical protein
MTEASEWVPVSMEARKARELKGGQVTVHWNLAGGSTGEWLRIFTPIGTKSGSGVFVMSRSEPEAHSGYIAWTVPQEDIESAHNYVKQSVQETNNRYQQYLMKKEQTAAAEESKEALLAEQLATLQRQLDSFN